MRSRLPCRLRKLRPRPSLSHWLGWRRKPQAQVQRRASRLKSHVPQDPESGARSSRQRLRTQGSTPSRLDICNTSATPRSRRCCAAHPICPHPQKQVWEESGWQKHSRRLAVCWTWWPHRILRGSGCLWWMLAQSHLSHVHRITASSSLETHMSCSKRKSKDLKNQSDFFHAGVPNFDWGGRLTVARGLQPAQKNVVKTIKPWRKTVWPPREHHQRRPPTPSRKDITKENHQGKKTAKEDHQGNTTKEVPGGPPTTARKDTTKKDYLLRGFHLRSQSPATGRKVAVYSGMALKIWTSDYWKIYLYNRIEPPQNQKTVEPWNRLWYEP